MAWAHFVQSTSQLSAQPRIPAESWFAWRYSLRESVAHYWRRRPKLRPHLVMQRTEALLCEGPLRDLLPLRAVFFVFPEARWVSCTTLCHSCSEDPPR